MLGISEYGLGLVWLWGQGSMLSLEDSGEGLGSSMPGSQTALAASFAKHYRLLAATG